MSAPKAAVPALARVESHFKSFLARRWLALTWRAAVLSGLAFAVGTTATSGFEAVRFVLKFVLGIAIFPVASYSILWSRRSLIIKPPTLRAQSGILPLVLSNIADVRVLQLLLAYVLSGLVVSGAYCLSLSFGSPASELGLATPTARHPWHLNERFIFVIFGNTLLFLSLGVRDILGNGVRAAWPTKRYPFALAVQEALVGGLLALKEWNSLTIALGWSGLYTMAYCSVRHSVWRFLATHFGGVLRPFIINFAKASRNTITWSLAIHLATAALIGVTVVMVPVAVMMPYIVEPLSFETFARQSPLGVDRYLLTALQSRDPYYQNLTLMELLRVAHNTNRRKAIFSDVSSQPFLVLEIWQELLLILGRTHYALSSRNAGVSSGTATRPSQPAQPDPRQIALKQGDIFRPASKPKSAVTSVLQSVLEGPPTASPPAQVLKVMQSAADLKVKAIKEVGEVQSKVLGQIEGTQVGSKVVSEAKGLSQGISGLVGRSWARSKVQAVLPDLIPALRVIDLFAVLVVASIEEDTYGNVQQVLPATLEAIVRFRSALIGFENELLMQAQDLSKSGPVAAAEVKAAVEPAVLACRDAITRIGEAYGPSLSAFKFPPAIGHSLAEICRPPSPPQPREGGEQQQMKESRQ